MNPRREPALAGRIAPALQAALPDALRAALLLVSVLQLAACSGAVDAPSAPEPPARSANAAVTPPRAASPVAADGVSTPARPAAKPEFPSLKLDTFDGAHYDLAEHRGRWVVVNFWATWCAPCLKEIPDLAALDTARDDIEVIGLDYEEIEHADMVAFLKQHAIPYPIAVLDVYAPPADFETPRGLPMTYLIAPDGRVARTFLGPVDVAALKATVAAGKPAN